MRRLTPDVAGQSRDRSDFGHCESCDSAQRHGVSERALLPAPSFSGISFVRVKTSPSMAIICDG